MNKIALTLVVTFFVIFVSTSTFAQDRPLGRVVDVKGSSFIYSNGKTRELKSGELLYPQSEIMVEMSGQVTFTDNADHRFHISSSSSVLLDVGKVELRNGELWVQSINPNDEYSLVSANAKVDYTSGEAVFSYDSTKGKSQLLVINGMMKFANLRMNDFDLHVGEGYFSYVDPSFEGGKPRTPTIVGNKTYSMTIASFAGVSPMSKNAEDVFRKNDTLLGEKTTNKAVTRYIASVEPAEVVVKVKDARKVIPTTKPSKFTAKKEVKKEAVQFKIFGLSGYETSPTTAMYDWKMPGVKVENKIPRLRIPASKPIKELELENTVDIANEDEVTTAPAPVQYRESDVLLQRLNDIK